MLRTLGLGVVLAFSAQDDAGMSRGARAMLDAAISKAESHPDSVDANLARRIASSKNRLAFDALETVLRTAERTQTRVVVLEVLPEFAGSSQADAAHALLVDRASLATSALETDRASQALRTLGPRSLASLREIAETAPSFHARLHALLQIAVAEQAQDLDMLAAIARNEWHDRLVRLGLPTADPDWQERYSQLRRSSLRSWSRLSPDRGEVAVSLLQDRDPTVQAVALEISAQRDVRKALFRALAILGGEEPLTLKRAAIDVLRRLDTADAVARILDVARTGASELHGCCLQALRTMDDTNVLNEVLPLSSTNSARKDAVLALEVLALHSSDAVNAGLERLIVHREPTVRAAAVRVLGDRGSRQSSAKIRKQTRARDPEVRAAAIVAYSRLHPVDGEWRAAVAELRSSREVLVRIAVAQSLAFFSDRTTLPTLEALAADSDWRVRAVAVDALAKVRSASSVDFLIQRLSRERRVLREKIARSLRQITGAPLGDTPNEWQRWWLSNGTNFVTPTLRQIEEIERRRATAAANVRTASRFYGIPVTSDHIALVVDVSGSMSTPVRDEDGEIRSRLDVAKREIDALLDRLVLGTFLQLVHFSSNAHAWKRRLEPMDAAAAASAATAVDRWRASGHTNLFDAIDLALRDPAVDTLYILSDGYPTTGKLVQPLEIREEVRRRNAGGMLVIHTISIGMESDLLRWLAEDSGGTHVQRL